ncbi:MAG TPA: hypothetical protein VIF14_16815 [Alphaproteobacteria bacterium]|jgi:hypothetical protein
MQPFLKLVPVTGLHASALPGELALWLERALGASGARRAAAPGEWRDAAGEARDTVLRALAQRFYPCVPVSTQAARIHAHAETYAFVRWPRDRERTQIPARYRGTPDEYLWAAFKSGATMPLPMRDLRRILIGVAEGDG